MNWVSLVFPAQDTAGVSSSCLNPSVMESRYHLSLFSVSWGLPGCEGVPTISDTGVPELLWRFPHKHALSGLISTHLSACLVSSKTALPLPPPCFLLTHKGLLFLIIKFLCLDHWSGYTLWATRQGSGITFLFPVPCDGQGHRGGSLPSCFEVSTALLTLSPFLSSLEQPMWLPFCRVLQCGKFMAFAHSKPQFDVCNFSCVDSGGLNGWACYCTDGWTPIPWFLQVLDGTPEGTLLTDSWWTAGSRGENNWAKTLLSWEHLHALLSCGNFSNVS